jgi:hypothetical protein
MWMALAIILPVGIIAVVSVIIHRDVIGFLERNPGARIQWITTIYRITTGGKGRTAVVSSQQADDKLNKLLLLQRIDTAIKQLPKRERPYFRDKILCIPEGCTYQEMLRAIAPIAVTLDASLKFHGLRRPDEIRQLTAYR